MTAPKRRLTAADLLHGEDHEFIVNIYLAALRRWPDEAGYRHFHRLVANRPEHRLDALREIAGSEEARRLGALVEVAADPVPGDPNRARDAMMDIRTEVLNADIARLREALALLTGVGGAEVEALQRELAEAREAELRAEINALRLELRAALAAGATSLKPPVESPAESPVESLALGLARLIDGQVQARLGALEAQWEARLQQLEARLPAAPAA